MNIRKSMYSTVSILIIIPFLLFSLLISYIYSSKLNNIITDSLYSVTNSQIAEMTDFCTQQMNNLVIVGNLEASHSALHGNGNVDKDTIQYLNNLLTSQVQLTSYLISSAIIDTDLRVISCSEKEYKTYANNGITPLIEKMDNKPFYISDVMEYKQNGKEYKSVVAISRIEDHSKTLGYVLAEINLDFYNNIREHVKLWNDSTIYLLDGQEQIISAGTPEDKRNFFITSAKERKDYSEKYNAIDHNKNPQGSFTYEINNQKYITYYSNVQYTDWMILLTVNLDNYLDQQTIYIILVCFLVLLCGALAIWIGAFTSKRIVHPISHISDTLDNIEQKQDYSLRVNIKRMDELGNLSLEINQLLDFIEVENLYKIQQQRFLEQKADLDALTKVLNKEKIYQCLIEAVEHHYAEQTAIAVLFVDIDDFKSFNTDYGHSVGDQVLLFISSLLVQETNGMVGRIGGDEFLVIVEEPERLNKLDCCLQHINELSQNQFRVPEKGINAAISCCIGCVIVDFSILQAQCPTPEQLINIADSAMYEIKNNGKCGYIIRNFLPKF